MGEKLDHETLARLSEPFRPDQVRWKPQVISETVNALAVAYVDPRVVSERLDQVVGGDWSFHWEPLGVQGDRLVVKSSLTVMGVTREDVGEYVLSDREQADPWKSAVSDGLKRAAVHFGVGRYLYWLEAIWCAYDRRKHEFIDEPYVDQEGRVRVRHRQPGSSRPTVEGRGRQRTGGDSSSGASGVPDAQSSSAAARQETVSSRTLREASAERDARVPWEQEFRTWMVLYLKHQQVEMAGAEDVLGWLVEQGEMTGDLGSYAALSDAQAAFIHGVPGFVRAHSPG